MFSAVFIVEAVVKLIAFGGRYFRDPWNVFDFVIVVGSLLFTFLKVVFGIDLSLSTQVVRALRIGRIFKLFRNLKSLQVIFITFLDTLPAMANVGGLMGLFVYIFSVVAMNLFAAVKMKPPMHWQLHF